PFQIRITLHKAPRDPMHYGKSSPLPVHGLPQSILGGGSIGITTVRIAEGRSLSIATTRGPIIALRLLAGHTISLPVVISYKAGTALANNHHTPPPPKKKGNPI